MQWYKPLVCKKIEHEREVYSYTDLPQETRKSSNNPILHLKEIESKQEMSK